MGDINFWEFVLYFSPSSEDKAQFLEGIPGEKDRMGSVFKFVIKVKDKKLLHDLLHRRIMEIKEIDPKGSFMEFFALEKNEDEYEIKEHFRALVHLNIIQMTEKKASAGVFTKNVEGNKVFDYDAVGSYMNSLFRRAYSDMRKEV